MAPGLRTGCDVALVKVPRQCYVYVYGRLETFVEDRHVVLNDVSMSFTMVVARKE